MSKSSHSKKINTIVNNAIKFSNIRIEGDKNLWYDAKKAFKGMLLSITDSDSLNDIYDEKDNEELGTVYNIHLALCHLLKEKKENPEYEDFWCEQFCLNGYFSISTVILTIVCAYMIAEYLNTCDENDLSVGAFSCITEVAA